MAINEFKIGRETFRIPERVLEFERHVGRAAHLWVTTDLLERVPSRPLVVRPIPDEILSRLEADGEQLLSEPLPTRRSGEDPDYLLRTMP